MMKGLTVTILFAILGSSFGYSYIVPANIKNAGVCFYNGHALPQGESQLGTGCQHMVCNEDGSINVDGCSPISLPNCTLIKDTSPVKTYPDCCEMTYQCTDSDGNTYIKQWNQLKPEGVSSPFLSLFKKSTVAPKVQKVVEEVVVPYSFVVPASLKNPGICFLNGHVLPKGETQLPTGCQHQVCNEDGSILIEGCSPISLPNCTLIEGTSVDTPFPDCCTMTYQCLDTDGNTFTQKLSRSTSGKPKLAGLGVPYVQKVKEVLEVPYSYIVPASFKNPGICFYNGHLLPQGDSQLPNRCQHMVCNADGSILVEGCSPSKLPNCTLIKDPNSVISYPECCVMTYECLDSEGNTYIKKLGGNSQMTPQSLITSFVQKEVEDNGVPFSYIVPASFKNPGICFYNGHQLPQGDSQLPNRCQHMVCNADGSILVEGCSPSNLPNCTLIKDPSAVISYPDCCAMTYECLDSVGNTYVKKVGGNSPNSPITPQSLITSFVQKEVESAGVPYSFIVPASLKNPGICFLNGHVLPKGETQLPTGCQHQICNDDGSILIEGCSPVVLPNCTLVDDSTPYPDCCAMTYECVDSDGKTYMKKLSGGSSKNVGLFAQRNMATTMNVKKVVEDDGVPYSFIVPASLKNPGICFLNGHVLPKGDNQLATGCQHMMCNDDGSILIEGCSPVVLPNCTLIEDGATYPDCCAMTYQCLDVAGNTYIKKLGGISSKNMNLRQQNMATPNVQKLVEDAGTPYSFIIPASFKNPGVCFYNGHVLPKGETQSPTVCQHQVCNEDGSALIEGCSAAVLPNCTLIKDGTQYPDCCAMTYECMDDDGNAYVKKIAGGSSKHIKITKPNMVMPSSGGKTTAIRRGYSYIIPANIRNPGVCFFSGHVLAKGDNQLPSACQNMRCNEDGSITVQGCGRISLPNCVLIEGSSLSKSYPDCCEMTYQCYDHNGNKFIKKWNQLTDGGDSSSSGKLSSDGESGDAVSILSPIILQFLLV